MCLLLVACGGTADTDPAAGSRAGTSAPAVVASNPQSLDSLFAAAQDVYFLGEYDSAAILLTRMRETAEREGSIPPQARALTWIGLVHYKLADYPKARQIGEEALALKLRHRLVDEYSRSWNALGLVAWDEDRLPDAEEYFQRAIASARDVGDRRAAATARANLALVQTELGQFALARSGFLAQQTLMAELGDALREGNALTNLGMLEIRLGNPNGAIEPLRTALDLYQRVDYPAGIQSALGQLGTAYTALGDSRQAFTTLDSALVIATAQGLEGERASILEALAEIYRGAGDFRRAMALYDSAGSLNADLGLDEVIRAGEDLRGEADIHARLGDIARARGAAEEALAIHRRAGAPVEVLRDLLLLAEIEDRLNEDDEVQVRLREARPLAVELGSRISRVEVGLTEARIADRHRRSDEVLAALERVMPDLARGGYSAEWEARLLESRALERLGRNREAAEAGRRALATVERVRGNFGSGVLRTAFVADKSEVYAHLISVLLRLGEVEEAFAVADAARGRVLLERLSAAGDLGKGESRTEAFSKGEILLVEIDRLVESIDAAEARSERTPDQSRAVDELYERLARARDAYEGLLVRTAETDPDQAAFLGGAQTDVSAVRAALREGQLLVEYFVPPEGAVLLFAASRDRTVVLESPVTTRNLTSRVRLARELMARDRESEGPLQRVLASLHDALIGPLVRAGILSGIDDLIIVPHQVLVYLPFAALRDGTTDRFLVQDFTSRILPSAAVLPVLAGRRPVEGLDGGAAAFAPFPDQLPGTRSELQAVTAGSRSVRRFVGSDATEKKLRNALRESAVVHVATHGVMNAQNPMFSRLEMARDKGGQPADDGRLEVHELLGLEVDTRLVFLSGCETGVGAAHSTAFALGEDYMTLAQAFLHAGAGSVIATLWPVEDAGAAAFAEAFYTELDRRPPVTALATVQRRMLADDRYRSPYHWAAYQLAGYGPAGPGAHPNADIRAIR